MTADPTTGLFPEFREMISTGRRYAAGECEFRELYGASAACAAATKYFSARPELAEMAKTWTAMIERRWDEWGLVPQDEKLNEDELRDWIRQELDVFEPFDPIDALEQKLTEQDGGGQAATRPEST